MLVQGYFGGKIDLFFQRFMEIWSAIPTLYVLIILSKYSSAKFLVASRHFTYFLVGWDMLELCVQNF